MTWTPGCSKSIWLTYWSRNGEWVNFGLPNFRTTHILLNTDGTSSYRSSGLLFTIFMAAAKKKLCQSWSNYMALHHWVSWFCLSPSHHFCSNHPFLCMRPWTYLAGQETARPRKDQYICVAEISTFTPMSFFSHCLEKQYGNLGQFFPGLHFFSMDRIRKFHWFALSWKQLQRRWQLCRERHPRRSVHFPGKQSRFYHLCTSSFNRQTSCFWLIFTSKCWEPTEPTDMLTFYVSGSQKKQPTGWMVVWKDTSQKAGFDMIIIRYFSSLHSFPLKHWF